MLKIHTFDHNHTPITLYLPNERNNEIEASHLMALPALIDPHVHFRTPGNEHKENWISAARAAISGGVSTVFDMPNTSPSTTTYERVIEKKQLIETQLNETKIPLRYHLYFGAHKDCLSELEKVKDHVIGIKIYMGSTTGSLLVDDPLFLDELFAAATELDMLIAVHAEDESIIKQRQRRFNGIKTPHIHSKIRDRSAAISSTEQALLLAKKYGTRLGIMHMSTKEELALVKELKKEKVPVFAEVAPHHLFLNGNAYDTWGTLVQMNPPLREQEDCQALWKGIQEGTIDTIGTDHAPHTIEEKKASYGNAPSGIPGIETYLPLFLNAVNKGHLEINRLIELTHENINRIYKLEAHQDWVLVNLHKQKKVNAKQFNSKCKWSPFDGISLKGWPEFVVLKDKLYPCFEDSSLHKESVSQISS